MKNNIILNSDAYKHSHPQMMDKKIVFSSSYFEPRLGTKQVFDYLIFCGLQGLIKEYLMSPITKENIEEADDLLKDGGMGWYKSGWEYILNNYGGFLPLKIQALPEGTIVPCGNAVAQFINTNMNIPWLSSFIETAFMRLWYPMTVATVSYECKRVINKYCLLSSDNGVSPYHLNDFGSRGASSHETSMIGGMGHLLSFQGTDNIPAIRYVKEYYNTKLTHYSVKASEHSITTSYGRENEHDAIKHFIMSNPNHPISIVIDSYDDIECLNFICNDVELVEHIKQRSLPLIVRPDSRTPIEAITMCFDMLSDKYGYHTNSKGYKVLPDYLRIIQGDSISLPIMDQLCQDIINLGISMDNVVFGMGGALITGNKELPLTRDTGRFAIKCNQVTRYNGQIVDVYKEPIGSSMKKSKSGRQAVINEDGTLKTIREDELGNRINQLRDVFLDGELLVDEDFETIKGRIS